MAHKPPVFTSAQAGTGEGAATGRPDPDRREVPPDNARASPVRLITGRLLGFAETARGPQPEPPSRSDSSLIVVRCGGFPPDARTRSDRWTALIAPSEPALATPSVWQALAARRSRTVH